MKQKIIKVDVFYWKRFSTYGILGTDETGHQWKMDDGYLNEWDAWAAILRHNGTTYHLTAAERTRIETMLDGSTLFPEPPVAETSTMVESLLP